MLESKQGSYHRRISVGMVPHIWIQATFGPFLIVEGLNDFTEFYFYLGVFFLCVASYSIYKGVSALFVKIYSDFVMLALIPIALPLMLTFYIIFK